MTATPAASTPLWKQAQFLWVEGRLSNIERLCLQSFLDHGYDVSLYHYGPLQNVPEGVRMLDAREILPEARLSFDESPSGKSPANFSDLFRYHMLNAKGGWWFDMDFIALKPPQPLDELRFASTWEGQWGECATGCAIYAPAPGHPMVQWLVEQAERIIAIPEREYCAVGPFLVQDLVKQFKLAGAVAPWYVFCPYPWRMISRIAYRSNREMLLDQLRKLKHVAKEIYDREFKMGRVRGSSVALHLHNEILRSANIDKNGVFHPFSLLEKYKRRHRVS